MPDMSTRQRSIRRRRETRQTEAAERQAASDARSAQDRLHQLGAEGRGNTREANRLRKQSQTKETR